MHHDLLGDTEPEDLLGDAARALPAGLATKVAENFATTTCWPGATSATSRAWPASSTSLPLLLVPHLDGDVHDIEGLLRVHRYLFASEARAGRG